MYPKKLPKSDEERFLAAFNKKVGTTPEVYLRRKLAAGMEEQELQRLYDMLAIEIARKVRCTALRYETLRPKLYGTAQRHKEKAASETIPTCSRCGAAMVLRVHKTGPQAGQKFWGCSNFPACRNKLSLKEPKK